MRDPSPCYHCTKEIKCPWCHTFCPDFIAWEAANNKRREEVLQIKLQQHRLAEQRSDAIKKVNDRHGRRTT